MPDIQPEPTLRFLLSIIVLVFARHAYWRLRAVAHADASGLTTPVWETPRVSELEVAVEVGVTEPPQPQG